MEKNGIKILILEDDSSLGAAMKEAFERSGASAVHVTKPNDAITEMGKTSFDCLFVDCMLPGANGAEFVENIIRPQFPSLKAKIYLMSGIYTDKAYVAEAIKKTRAAAFIQKPFNLNEVLNLVQVEGQSVRAQSAQQSVNISARKKLYGMFSDPKVTPRKKRKIIEEIEEVSGYDLPFIYSLLVETNSSGTLFIYHDSSNVSSVTFCNGHIIGVDTEDKTTYLGEMLIQSGYATPKDVQAALREKSTRRIGQQLIMQNQLSPHAFDLILAEQMNIRLSRTIVEEKVRINFASAETEMIYPNIESDTLLSYLHDWIASKISVKWLKSLYGIWMDNIIEVAPSFNLESPAFQMHLVKSLDGLAELLQKQEMTLKKIIESKKFNEEPLFKALHFLLTKGYIVFAQKMSAQTLEERKKQFEQVYAQIKDKSSREVYSYVEQNTMALESADSMYQEFMATLGVEPEDKDLSSTWKAISQIVQEAVSTGFDSQSKNAMLQEKAKREAENKLRANTLLEDAKQYLMTSKYAQAVEAIRHIMELNPGAFQVRIYSAWSKIATVDPAKKATQLKEIELELAQIPAEEKYDSLYPFVMGLFYKTKGDMNSAKKSFEKSTALDGSFILARRELSLLENMNKKQDILKMDLKDVVSGFFKKK